MKSIKMTSFNGVEIHESIVEAIKVSAKVLSFALITISENNLNNVAYLEQ